METAIEIEEQKLTKNMLQPISMDRERAAYTKIEQYNSNGGVPS